MAYRNEGFRQRMLQFMLLCTLVLSPLPEDVAARVDEYADELGVSNDMLRVAHRYAKGSLGLALIDFQRSGYMQLWEPHHAEALHTSRASKTRGSNACSTKPWPSNGKPCARSTRARSGVRS